MQLYGFLIKKASQVVETASGFLFDAVKISKRRPLMRTMKKINIWRLEAGLVPKHVYVNNWPHLEPKEMVTQASLRQRALALDSNIKIIKSFIGSEVKKGSLDSKHADKLGEDLSRASYTLSEGDAATFLPCKSHGRFLRMFLGPINVRANRKDVQLKVKEEYYSFRIQC
nr:transmembrane protein 120 homolog [Tanacetum cinerariifolium]